MSEKFMSSKTTVYGIKFFFRGRQLDEESEPPSNLIDDFIDLLIGGLARNEWDAEKDQEIEHDFCTEECAIETCIVMGRPYATSLEEALAAAKNRKGMLWVLYELEKKLSEFYETEIRVETLVMDTWLCCKMKEVDNVVICLEPVNR